MSPHFLFGRMPGFHRSYSPLHSLFNPNIRPKRKSISISNNSEHLLKFPYVTIRGRGRQLGNLWENNSGIARQKNLRIGLFKRSYTFSAKIHMVSGENVCSLFSRQNRRQKSSVWTVKHTAAFLFGFQRIRPNVETHSSAGMDAMDFSEIHGQYDSFPQLSHITKKAKNRYNNNV